MSNVKERILGAVTVMSEKDANTLWGIIIENFPSWNNIEEIEKNPDCRNFISSEEALKELGL